jgi:hypothetical protein
MFPIGRQRVGIVTTVPVLDDGDPTYTEFGEPIVTDATVWVDGCVLEVQTMSEDQGVAVTTSETAVVLMPAAGDRVRLVSESGSPTGYLSVTDITSGARLREYGTTRDYVMRGDAVLHRDIRGRADHVECLCEHEAG